MAEHRVYWTDETGPQVEPFTDIDLMLKFCEILRKRQHAGEQIRFITSASEDPNCTSLRGVDVTGSDYNWRKRRP